MHSAMMVNLMPPDGISENWIITTFACETKMKTIRQKFLVYQSAFNQELRDSNLEDPALKYKLTDGWHLN